MSKPKPSPNDPQPPAANYTGETNRRRLTIALARKGITTARQLHEFMSAIDSVRYPGRPPLGEQTWRRILTGETDPVTNGNANGRRPVIFELADALDVSVEWLLSADLPETEVSP